MVRRTPKRPTLADAMHNATLINTAPMQKAVAKVSKKMADDMREALASPIVIPGRKPSPEPDWRDARDDPPPPMRWTRERAIAELIERGETRDRAVQYLDLFEEYREATLNIRKYGVVVMNAHVRQPMENPYMSRRDKARQALERFRDIDAPWLWEELSE